MKKRIIGTDLFDRCDRIIVDSSELMNPQPLRMCLQRYGDRIRTSGRRIAIPEPVRLEIARHLGSADPDKSAKAMACMYVVDEFRDLFICEGDDLPEELMYDAFADPEILAEMTRDKRRYRQLLITSDGGLASDALDLNGQISCRGFKISVRRIAPDGTLKSFGGKRCRFSMERAPEGSVHAGVPDAADQMSVPSEPAAAAGVIPETGDPADNAVHAPADNPKGSPQHTETDGMLGFFSAFAAGALGAVVGTAAISLFQTQGAGLFKAARK